jgi:branched-chain amino acid aminotransferase
MPPRFRIKNLTESIHVDPMKKFCRFASVDGRVTPLEEARISVLDRGFLYGDSVYEVFRTYNGVPLLSAAHMARLENSAAMIGMQLGFSQAEIMQQIRNVVRASGAADLRQEVYVRFHVTRGVGPIDLYPGAEPVTSLVILVKEVPPWPQVFSDIGVSLRVTQIRRNPVEALDPNIKSGNYLNNVMAVMEAREAGADDCLMLNPAGQVTESSNSNVFFVRQGRVMTPAGVSGNLRGLTRQALIEAASTTQLAIEETMIREDLLPEMEECFLTSATREVMPVCRLSLRSGQDISFPAGGGVQTRRLQQIYREFVQQHVRDHAADSLWC